MVERVEFGGGYTLEKILDEPEGWEVQNMLTVGHLIAQSAHWRAESRGCHMRTDAPQAEETYAAHDCWRRGEGEPELQPVAIPGGVTG